MVIRCGRKACLRYGKKFLQAASNDLTTMNGNKSRTRYLWNNIANVLKKMIAMEGKAVGPPQQYVKVMTSQ